MAGRGGAQPGGGRKKGTPNKVTQQQVKRALESGPLPSEELLNLGRMARGVASRLQTELGMAAPDFKFAEVLGTKLYAELKEWMKLAGNICSAAAPYYAYKLASMKITGAITDLSGLTDDELDQVERVNQLIAARRGDTHGAGSSLN